MQLLTSAIHSYYTTLSQWRYMSNICVSYCMVYCLHMCNSYMYITVNNGQYTYLPRALYTDTCTDMTRITHMTVLILKCA